MSDWKVGETAPPFHVYCRSITVPAFDDEFDLIGERAARGEDSKTYYVPSTMTYKQWQKSFVDGDKSGLQEVAKDGNVMDMDIQNVTENYLKNATPNQGTIAYEAGYRMGIYRKEMEIASRIHSTLGGDITLLQETVDCNKKTPDFTWNGKAWELKSISSAKAADSALRTAAKQIQKNPGGVILELTSGIDMAGLEKVLADRCRRVGIDEMDILIMAQNVLKKVLRYKK